MNFLVFLQSITTISSPKPTFVSAFINSLKKYKAAIDRAIGLKPWQQGSAYEASYMPLFFSDRDEFLVYTIRLLDHNGPAWKFDVQKYLEERGIVLANW